MAPDPAAAPHVDLAREALLGDVGADAVGEWLGVTEEDEATFTHAFACQLSGYPGWYWAVTIASPAGQDYATVDEVVLLPGDTAVVAPRWVPWRERLRPGDMAPGDLLPVEEDDPRLVPAYLAGEDPEEHELRNYRDTVAELGLGRARVLSLEGRQAAGDRWWQGEGGPDSPLAQSAPARCGTCGFLVRLDGPLSSDFGVCANEFANDDGRVVAYQHGCGAHSEAQLRRRHQPQPLPDLVYDTTSGT